MSDQPGLREASASKNGGVCKKLDLNNRVNHSTFPVELVALLPENKTNSASIKVYAELGNIHSKR